MVRDGELALLGKRSAVYTVNTRTECLLVGWTGDAEKRIRCFIAVLYSGGAGIRMPKAAAIRKAGISPTDLIFEVYFSESSASEAYRVRTHLRPRFNHRLASAEPVEAVPDSGEAPDILSLLNNIRSKR